MGNTPPFTAYAQPGTYIGMKTPTGTLHGEGVPPQVEIKKKGEETTQEGR